MAKHLLFIRGIYDTIDLFITAFAESFRRQGCECFVLDAGDPAKLETDLKNLLENIGIDAVITFNNIGYNLCISGGENVWEQQGIPFVDILMDHPFHYDRALRRLPQTTVLYVTDKNHVRYVKRFYPDIHQVEFMPHAGMEADITVPADPGSCLLCTDGAAEHPKITERPIEVLYAGGLSRYVAEGLVPDLGEIREFDAFELTQQVLGELMRHPEMTTEDAIERYFQAIGKKFEPQQLCRYITELRFLDSYATSFYREQAVRILVEHGIPVTVFGGGWEQCEWAEHENLHYGGKVPAPQVLELMNHSRIVLNSMTWYKNGIHDRIINGMLAKALIVTDTSVYLDETFPKGEDRVAETFRLTQIEALPELVRECLAHPDVMQETAERGYGFARANHTWKQRAVQVLADLADM